MKTNIVEVDGKHRGNGFFTKYELAPGEHTIKISFYVGIGARGVAPVVGFKVAAGETYELLYESYVKEAGYNYTSYEWRPYIVNKRTHQRLDLTISQ